MNLKEYLQDQWRRCNHPKYQRYFEEWYSNITPTQKLYFEAWSKGLMGLPQS